MTKVSYKSPFVNNTLLPPVEQSYRIIQDARNQASNISISIGAGWGEVCELLEKSVQDTGKFIFWIQDSNAMYQQKITENIEITRKIPGVEVKKRERSVKSM